MKIGKGTITYDPKREDKKTFTREVSWQELETADDVLSVIGTDAGLKELVKNANYGANLNARSKVRNEMMTQEAGPDKAIDKAVADLVKARLALGRPITPEAARALIVG